MAGGGDGRGDPAALQKIVGGDRDGGVLRGYLAMVRGPDMEAARLGLQFVEMVLRMLPGGAQAVEAADGIDALEELQFRSVCAPADGIAGMRVPCMAARWGPNVLLCMPNRTNCILLFSVMDGLPDGMTGRQGGRVRGGTGLQQGDRWTAQVRDLPLLTERIRVRNAVPTMPAWVCLETTGPW
jgi:hypothetical protein